MANSKTGIIRTGGRATRSRESHQKTKMSKSDSLLEHVCTVKGLLQPPPFDRSPFAAAVAVFYDATLNIVPSTTSANTVLRCGAQSLTICTFGRCHSNTPAEWIHLIEPANMETADGQCQVAAFSETTGKAYCTRLQGSTVSCIDFSSAASLSSSGPREIARTACLVAESKIGTEKIMCIALHSSNALLCVGTSEGNCFLFNAHSLHLLKRLKFSQPVLHVSSVDALGFVAAFRDSLCAVDPRRFQVCKYLPLPCVEDPSRIDASSSLRRSRLPSRQAASAAAASRPSRRLVAISRDGRLLASVADRGVFFVVDLQREKLVATWNEGRVPLSINFLSSQFILVGYAGLAQVFSLPLRIVVESFSVGEGLLSDRIRVSPADSTIVYYSSRIDSSFDVMRITGDIAAAIRREQLPSDVADQEEEMNSSPSLRLLKSTVLADEAAAKRRKDICVCGDGDRADEKQQQQ